MATVTQIGPRLGMAPTCAALGLPRAALLKTFADQAVIAIENVRLFKELQARNAELTESLAQQTATAEILRVISQSLTDVRPVFETILEQGVRLCAAQYAAVFRFDGSRVHLAATHNLTAADRESLEREYPMAPARSKLSGRAILTREIAQVADVLADVDYERTPQARAFGVRSILAVPMVRSGEPVGAILIYRREVGLFPDSQVRLLQTFAEQAVIAVENVRLFTELEERNTELTESLARQTATGDILRAISASPTDVQPVFDAIARNATVLCGGVLGRGRGSRVRPAGGRGGRRVAELGRGADAPRGHGDRDSQRATNPRWTVPGPGDLAAPDLRGPGGDRDRERAAVQGA